MSLLPTNDVDARMLSMLADMSAKLDSDRLTVEDHAKLRAEVAELRRMVELHKASTAPVIAAHHAREKASEEIWSTIRRTLITAAVGGILTLFVSGIVAAIVREVGR